MSAETAITIAAVVSVFFATLGGMHLVLLWRESRRPPPFNAPGATVPPPWPPAPTTDLTALEGALRRVIDSNERLLSQLITVAVEDRARAAAAATTGQTPPSPTVPQRTVFRGSPQRQNGTPFAVDERDLLAEEPAS